MNKISPIEVLLENGGRKINFTSKYRWKEKIQILCMMNLCPKLERQVDNTDNQKKVKMTFRRCNIVFSPQLIGQIQKGNY